MKIPQNILVLLLALLLIGCGGEKKQTGLLTVDVTKTYPEKEIVLQDIADVAYIPLETRDDVLIAEENRIAFVSDSSIVVFNSLQGDVCFFDREGKFIHKFNNKGQSGKEYLQIIGIIVDELKKEIFVVDAWSIERVQVYDMHGKYKRTLNFQKNYSWAFFNFDSNNFIYFQNPNKDYISALGKRNLVRKPQITFINKDTGKKDTIIKLSFTDGVSPFVKVRKKSHFARYTAQPAPKFLKNSNGIIVNEACADTIYLLNKHKKLIPLLTRTPKITPEDKPMKMIGINGVSLNAIYLTVIDKKYEPKGDDNFPKKKYMWDKTNNQIFEYTLKNADVKEVDKLARLEEYSLITTDKLMELLEEGKLKGKLKEIAKKLTEDDNPVLMKVTLK